MAVQFQSPLMEALGWSLIDSLWQMGTMWLTYVGITRNGSRFSPAVRHSLAFAGTVVGTLVFLSTILLNVYTVSNYRRPFSLAYLVHSHAPEIASLSFLQTVVPYLGYIYFPAVLISALRLFYQLSAANNVHRNPVTPDNKIIEYVYHLCNRFGINKKVTVWISEKVESPLTLGFFKPVIILPLAVINRLSVQQVEAVLTHEVFHIKRNDYLLNIILIVSQAILFFNPFSRLLCSIVKKERENCCDDKVIETGHDAWNYSEALFLLGKYRHDNQLGIAATGAGKEFLLQRIRRIMNHRSPSPSVAKNIFAFFLCLLMATFAGNHYKSNPVATGSQQEAIAQPVAFYYAETSIEIQTKSTEKAHPAPAKKNSPRRKMVTSGKESPGRPGVPLPPEPPDLTSQEPVATYVAAPEVIEFTMLDQHVPNVPDPVNCESPQPFVPASSFYFTGVDTAAGKTTISL